MFQKVLVAIAIASLVFVGYLLLKAYKPQWFKTEKEAFRPKREPAAPLPMPAPAPPVEKAVVVEDRAITPSGPNPPAAKAPVAPATISPEAAPLDPYDNTNMDTPVRDTVRRPELSFGPGVDNTDTAKQVAAGLASPSVSAPVSTFSPDFAQNGGSFMGAVFANDLQTGDEFAEA
jgi:hypothetical protein